MWIRNKAAHDSNALDQFGGALHQQEDETDDAKLEGAVEALTESDGNVVGESTETAFDAGDDGEPADKPEDDGEI